MKHVLWTVVGVLLAVPAHAQSPYVAGVLGGEIVRATTVTSGGETISSSNGETFSGALRVGTFIEPRVGVELELLRPGATRVEDDGLVYIQTLGTPAPVLANGPSTAIYPPPIISQESHIRSTTFSALAFVRQPIGARADLVYLGGVGFTRFVETIEFGTPGGPTTSRTTQYGVGPVVGAEARIGMTPHARLVAGIRLHAPGESLVDGWIIRPGLGVSWSF